MLLSHNAMGCHAFKKKYRVRYAPRPGPYSRTLGQLLFSDAEQRVGGFVFIYIYLYLRCGAAPYMGSPAGLFCRDREARGAKFHCVHARSDVPSTLLFSHESEGQARGHSNMGWVGNTHADCHLI